MIPYRLGLDLGTNSLGWCALKLDADGEPCGVLDAGVRILTANEEAGRDPQSKASLAGDRRAARAMRRRRDRFLRRQKRLMQTLVEHGLMPTEEGARKALEKLDPYWLRAAALDGPLEAHEIGRAIFHLNQRRGFKSNRIADAEDNEKSATKEGMRKLREALEASRARTLGELLARRHGRDKFGRRKQNADGYVQPESVRFRPSSVGAKTLYDWYPSRAMVEHELDAIWEAQKPHHAQLTDALLKRLKRIVIEQRPLKKPIVGRCTLRPEADVVEPYGFKIDLGERAPKAHPLFQRFRMLQDASQLRVTKPGRKERDLTLQERDMIVLALAGGSGHRVEFEMLRKAAKLPADTRFNYELAGRKGFQPDLTAIKLRSNKAFGKTWASLEHARRIEIVERLLGEEDEGALKDWLAETFGFDEARAEAISNIRLPQSHGNFGRAVLAELVDIMEAQSEEAADPETGEIYRRPLRYDEAVERLGRHHSDMRPDRKQRLPYYGSALARHVISKPSAPQGSQERIGRVPNPTVHIGLNQLRLVVNALIDTYGPPAEIVVELARELKLNQKRKGEIERENRENEKKNDERRERLQKCGQADTYGNRLLLRLYDELPPDSRVCVYSGETIGSLADLFSGRFDIDHILPHSRTLDDGFANKVLCTLRANREKGNRAPAEAWSGEKLQEIAERAEQLLPKKAWRFQPDAMERFEREGGFIARHLIDTQHMARLARTYLTHICDQVWVSPGRLTSMMRAKWGLNSLLPDHNFTDANQPKNRKDHRHHAIDAFVLACTTRGLLQRMARESGRAEDLQIDRLFADGFPEPYPGYRDDLDARLRTIVVSHKPDHGLMPGAQDDVTVTSGQLHEETAYGIVDEEIDGKRYNLVTRKPVHTLTEGEIERVRDADLRAALQQVAYEARQDGKKLAEALSEFAKNYKRDLNSDKPLPIRRVRLLKREETIRLVRHGDGFTKAYSPGDNHRIEIYSLPNGEWRGEGVTVYDANRPGFEPDWRRRHPDAALVMRVHRGDLLGADFGQGPVIYRVCTLDAKANRLKLAPHNEAGSLDKRHNEDSEGDPFRYEMKAYSRLKAAGARRVRVDPLGRRVSPVIEEKG